MKLLLADDHTLFRDALVQYIERAEPVAQVSLSKDFPGAMDVLNKDSAQDLVLLDFRMPGMNGLDGLKQIREKYPATPVALMSGVAEPSDVEKALDLGAVAYFPKTLSGKSLLHAIQKVLSGETFVPMDEHSGKVMPSYLGDRRSAEIPYPGMQDSQQSFEPAELFNLTPRESEVLTYLMRGVSNKEIANALNLKIVTVKLHVRGVCKKLAAKNRTQAALIAKERGLDKVLNSELG